MSHQHQNTPGYSNAVTRRALLGWVGAATAAGWSSRAQAKTQTTSASASASASAAPPFVAPTGALREFLLMRGALDGRLVTGYLQGQYYGVVEGELKPLFGVLAVTYTRWRALAHGEWLSASFEHAYYTDLDHGEVMTHWTNPYTGQTCTVPVWTSPATARVLRPDLSFAFAKAPPVGLSLEDVVSERYEQSGERVMVERTRSAMQRPVPAKPYRYSEIVTMRAPLAALEAPDAMQVRSANAYAAVSGWRPWQQMPVDAPGHLMAQGVGRYNVTTDEIPPVWLAATRRLHPDWWADPAQRLEPVFGV